MREDWRQGELSMGYTEEHERLEEYRVRKALWKKWGPYLSERAWGTVREDYSQDGNTWTYFTHDDARSRAYRWNEDGLGGICDRMQYLCFALSLWNGKDPFLKERMFGLSGPEGNHGEDAKDYWYYLDSTPTHSYMKMLYKYPQGEFPYAQIRSENKNRGYHDLEYELVDTKIFEEGKYFDVFIEYAKASEEDILIRVTAHNRGPADAPIHLLPTVWFRNTWSWGYEKGPTGDEKEKPAMRQGASNNNFSLFECRIASGEDYHLYCDESPELIFTENETNKEKLFKTPNASPYVKDAFHRYIAGNEKGAVNPAQKGTKGAAVYARTVPAGGSVEIRLRLSCAENSAPFKDFAPLFKKRIKEADEFYNDVQHPDLSDELKMVQRRAFAGLMWSKQFYYFDVEQWLNGDPGSSVKRNVPRNDQWEHLTTFDVLSMPDKWEYPYFCAWDTAFHCIPTLLIDPDFAKRQIELLTREWYIHPNGQLPAYEWNFSDVNPPVLAWCTWRAYKIDAKIVGKEDKDFLKGIFNKLLLNFTWWVNRKDTEGNNLFQGGFLGLDNISVFDRSVPLPTGGHIDQSDGTAWMGFFCTIMMRIALYLSFEEPHYQDIATKFFEHFMRISNAIGRCGGGKGNSLWDHHDGFFYDNLHLPDGTATPLKVRSLVGLLPLLAVETLEPEGMEQLKTFSRRMEWFLKKHPHTMCNVACVRKPGMGKRRLISILSEERLVSILKYMLDENEFLSPYGIRSVSKFHKDHPYTYTVNGKDYTVGYLPAESDSGLFGGNSNWRGPVWFPINFLIIESLQKYHHYFGDSLKVEFPTGSGNLMNLWDVSIELSKRLISLFTRNEEGKRPIFGGVKLFQEDPHWRDLILFNEYYHGDNGAGLGATHQTGWTALIAKLIQQSGEQL
ncbi:MAG: glucosidase [Parachlamydiales bacterium]|nr:glucosidase [Candidatus Acheromyda pituitae]